MSSLKLNTRGLFDQFLADGYKCLEKNVVPVGDVDPTVAVVKIMDMVNKGQVNNNGLSIQNIRSAQWIHFSIYVSLYLQTHTHIYIYQYIKMD